MKVRWMGVWTPNGASSSTNLFRICSKREYSSLAAGSVQPSSPFIWPEMVMIARTSSRILRFFSSSERRYRSGSQKLWYI